MSELETVYEKHFESRDGILLKPHDLNSYKDISVTDNVITYTDNDKEHNINLTDYDISLIMISYWSMMVQGARSYYRDIYFQKNKLY